MENNSDNDNTAIQVYLRIRPSEKPSRYVSRDDIDENRLIFNIPKADTNVFVNNSRSAYGFQFHGILDEKATQEQVFKTIGVPVVKSALEGFNSTIFAYGQTGSGKTFTITGGAERYADRGIIPRAISMVFKELHSRPDVNYTCFVSYLEIYLENGYDLLSEEHEDTTRLEDMQKVKMLEDEDGIFHFRNLSVHPVASEEEALNYLFIGDTNRAIGETDMNQSSSRSHCIFTLSVEGRRSGSDNVTRSKLNLVDLAGSERVHKTSSAGQSLREALYINVSLFHLERVIIALHEKLKRGNEKTHVPYRASMMTSILRDSLGGNCKTMMVATISPETHQSHESISTCNFAQRVAMVKNSARINEELEPELIIRRLKAELHKLREQIKFLKGENDEEDELNQEEKDELSTLVNEYVEVKETEEMKVDLNIGKITLSKISEVHSIFKRLVLKGRETLGNVNKIGGGGGSSTPTFANEEQLKSLKKTISQRDHEIAILVNMIKQGKGVVDGRIEKLSSNVKNNNNSSSSSSKLEGEQTSSLEKKKIDSNNKIHGVERCMDIKILDDPSLAFQWFRERYPGSKAMEENRSLLKQKYTEAKMAGEKVQTSQKVINHHKSKIEQIRKQRAVENALNNNTNQQQEEQEQPPCSKKELEHRKVIEKEKVHYKQNFGCLRELKSSIEHIQKIMEKSRMKVQSDFDHWYQVMYDHDTAGGSDSRGLSSSSSSSVQQKRTTSSLSGEEDQRTQKRLHESNNKNQHNQGLRQLRQEHKLHKGKPTPEKKIGTCRSAFDEDNVAVNIPPGVRLTGNKEIDDDIIAFYRAKEILLSKPRQK